MTTMYRVSGDLNKHGEQCGCLYYFKSEVHAKRAANEFGTKYIKVPYCHQTRTCDDWYYQ